MMNRFDRVISTLIYLQSKKLIKAQELADRYEVSLRTVYRDINTLKKGGVPIIGDPGIGYSIIEGYQLPPIMINEEEAAALLTAEKFIGKLTDSKTKDNYSNALNKIKAILRGPDKQVIDILDQSISITDNGISQVKPYLQDIFHAISSLKSLTITYRKGDGQNSERILEPIGCYHYNKHWYLVAFCRSKSDYRTFKVSRIEKLKVHESPHTIKHVSFKEYMDRLDDSWKNEHKLYTIVVSFQEDYLEYAESRKYYFGFVEQTIMNDVTTMTFLYSSIEVMARWLMQFGKHATVKSPISLKNEIHNIALELCELYN